LSDAAVVSCAAGTTAVTWLALTYVVASATPFRDTVVVLVNPDPVSVTVVSAAPAGSAAGLTPVIMGATAVPLLDEELPPSHPQRVHAKTVSTTQKRRPDFSSKRHQPYPA